MGTRLRHIPDDIKFECQVFAAGGAQAGAAALADSGASVDLAGALGPRPSRAIDFALRIVLAVPAAEGADGGVESRAAGDSRAEVELRAGAHAEPLATIALKSGFGVADEAALQAAFEATLAQKALAHHAVLARPTEVQRVAMAEITWRTQGGRFSLAPDPALNRLINGVIGRAQHNTGTTIFCTHTMSNHLSLLVGVTDCHQLAQFTRLVGGQLSQRVGRLRDLGMTLWARRNCMIPVDNTAADREARMRYCLANGTKEHLVLHPKDWPGVHSARLFCRGEALEGAWLDHDAWHKARRSNPDVRKEDFEIPYTVQHTKLPDYAHLSDAAYADLMRTWCDEMAADAAAVRAAARAAAVRGEGQVIPEPGDPQRLCDVSPHHRPEPLKGTPAPLIHAHDPQRRTAHRAAYLAYVETHRAARATLARYLQGLDTDLSEGLPPTGWHAIDPARVTAPIPIVLGSGAPATDTSQP